MALARAAETLVMELVTACALLPRAALKNALADAFDDVRTLKDTTMPVLAESMATGTDGKERARCLEWALGGGEAPRLDACGRCANSARGRSLLGAPLGAAAVETCCGVSRPSCTSSASVELSPGGLPKKFSGSELLNVSCAPLRLMYMDGMKTYAKLTPSWEAQPLRRVRNISGELMVARKAEAASPTPPSARALLAASKGLFSRTSA